MNCNKSEFCDVFRKTIDILYCKYRCSKLFYHGITTKCNHKIGYVNRYALKQYIFGKNSFVCLRGNKQILKTFSSHFLLSH